MGKIRFIVLALSTCLLVACAPSAQTIQTAIEQTQATNPILTFTPVPPTITPTNTLTETLIETPTIAPSPTLDLTLLQLHLKDFLLQESDLPLDAKYYQKSYFPMSNVLNNETSYAEETGRIDGWRVFYYKGADNVAAPETIYDYVDLFATSQGADLVITKYEQYHVTNGGYTEEISPPKIGNLTRSFLLTYYDTKSREYNISYEIDFSYQNFVQIVYGFGNQPEVVEFTRNIAHLLLTRLQTSPLINP